MTVQHAEMPMCGPNCEVVACIVDLALALHEDSLSQDTGLASTSSRDMLDSADAMNVGQRSTGCSD